MTAEGICQHKMVTNSEHSTLLEAILPLGMVSQQWRQMGRKGECLWLGKLVSRRQKGKRRVDHSGWGASDSDPIQCPFPLPCST